MKKDWVKIIEKSVEKGDKKLLAKIIKALPNSIKKKIIIIDFSNSGLDFNV